ncbi:zinc-ribbon and DUF3426 domain-containing protein [Tepidicella xavieri]|uniref:Putative Zn finger-like uncharacterized protein n=1 Tax=Tepidicella xavieri TaxID=360241 RepID=A0A4R6UH08_9BURK|nr:zinc-ribbon and DUF3426 domain-containing protein [Tepidicella xavieri]TDQ45306.1 putative Zn finger-like uncharacterized protein [Tepidicella xavieri]
MSFITRCPACSTSFKVVPDQLKISDGWVRCGHCHQIFDATLDLQPWWPRPEDAPASPAVSEPASSDPPAQDEARGPFNGGGVSGEPTPDAVSTEPLAQKPAESGPDESLKPPPPPRPETEAAAQPESDWPVHTPMDTGAWPAAAEPAPTTEPLAPSPSADTPAVSPPPPIEEAPPPLPSFVRQAQRRAFWRRPVVRGALWACSLALMGLLAAQASFHWRDQLASRVPSTRPALETLCDSLACEVSAPRQPDEVVIDSSVLLRRAAGRYSFNVVIRNKSRVEVAAPALELTLTAINDEVLVRRVLLPEEWPRPLQTLAPGAEWPVQFELALDGPTDQVMTGYRAILFYP